MGIDFGNALKAPFSGDGWIAKMLIGGILFCIPIVNFIPLGFIAEYINNLMNDVDQLPDFSDAGHLFMTGLKLVGGMIILAIPLLLVIFIISMAFTKSPFTAMALNYLVEIIFGFIALIMVANFSMDQKVLSMIDFSRAKFLVQDNHTLGSFILYLIVLYLIYMVLTIICGITVVGLVLVPFLMFAMTVSNYNLVGQFALNAPKLKEAQQIAAQN